jgi:hypothetical protein
MWNNKILKSNNNNIEYVLIYEKKTRSQCGERYAHRARTVIPGKWDLVLLVFIVAYLLLYSLVGVHNINIHKID